MTKMMKTSNRIYARRAPQGRPRRTPLIGLMGIAALILCPLSSILFAERAAPPSSQEAGASNLDNIFKQLTAYDGGFNSEAFWSLRNYVHGIKDKPEARLACEAKLVAFLELNATLTAKTAVCRQLRIIGSGKSVPVLEKMLRQREMTDIARYALEKIPGGEAEEALMAALRKTKSDIKKGIITSIGQRKTKAAVTELEKLLKGRDPEFTAAAAVALGQIGGFEAAEALGKSLSVSRPGLKEVVASALFRCAEEFAAMKSPEAAFQIYDRLLAEKLPVALRQAALQGKILTAGDKAPELILEMLAATDRKMHRPAISTIQNIFPPSNIGSVCKLLPNLAEDSQVQLLAVLAEFSGKSVLAAVRQAAKSPQPAVRIAGLKALEKVGDASTVPFLAEAAAQSLGQEQKAARTSLWGLKGREVDEAVMSLLSEQSSGDLLSELVLSIGERRIFAGKSLLVEQLSSPADKVRQEALRALKVIGTPSDVPGLLDLLLRTESEPEQMEIENAAAALAAKIADPQARSGAVKTRLESVTGAKSRRALLSVLGKIGDDSSLSLLRQALADPDADVVEAAVRVLADWPTATARDDLLKIATALNTDVHKFLALRAYIRLTGLEKFRSPEAAVKDLKQALDLAVRPEERKLVLGVLPDFACPDALKLAETLLADETIKAEAQAAVDKIKEILEKSTHSTPRAEARGMRRVNTERRFLPRFKNRDLAPSNVSSAPWPGFLEEFSPGPATLAWSIPVLPLSHPSDESFRLTGGMENRSAREGRR